MWVLRLTAELSAAVSVLFAARFEAFQGLVDP